MHKSHNALDKSVNPDYAKLPLAIRLYVDPEQYEWMPDFEKARLMQLATEPEDE